MPETPCSRTLSIDLAIKKTGVGGGKLGIQIERASIRGEERDKDSDGVTSSAGIRTEDK